ncbi:MAG TPA: hypothetical protein VKY31_05120 [Terriglobia bacterium]|nr:hypothetical protein [Terriglobia bacterium]
MLLVLLAMWSGQRPMGYDVRHGAVIVSMEELQAHPRSYYGKVVTVDGNLHRTFTETAFTINQKGFLRSGPDILIISNVPKEKAVTPLEHSVDAGRAVRITGLVQPYDRDKLEGVYGPLHLEKYEGQSFMKSPVLLVIKTPST